MRWDGWKLWDKRQVKIWDGKIWDEMVKKWEMVEIYEIRFLIISSPKLSISSIKSSLSISIVGSSKMRWVEMKDEEWDGGGWLLLWDDDDGWWLLWLFSKFVEYLNSNLLIKSDKIKTRWKMKERWSMSH